MMTKRLAGLLALLLLLSALLAGCGNRAEGSENGEDATGEAQEDVLNLAEPDESPTILVMATPAPAISARANADRYDVAGTLGADPDEGDALMFEATPSPTPLPTPTPEPTASPSPTPKPTKAPTPTPEYKLTKVKNEKAHMKAKGVNLREGPGEKYAVVLVLEYLQSMVITGKTTISEDDGEHVWYKVKFDDTTGFVRKDFVALGAEPTPTPKPTNTPKPTAEATPKPEPTPAPAIPQGSAGNYSEEDIYLAAKLIYAEGKSQSTESFQAMANVLYNRCNSKSFGGTVEREVYRNNQFTVVKYDSFAGLVPSDKALSAARQVFNEGVRVLPDGVLYFRAASKGENWSSKRKFYKTIGGNSYFY